MSTATMTAKRCVQCKKDVTGQKRMKDSSGQYWCVKCGEADQLKKGRIGDPCGGCGERFPSSRLTKYGAAKLCTACYKTATKGPGLRGSMGGGEMDKGRLIKMLAVMGLLAIGAAWRLMTLHSH
jgi:hypothetical protein